VPDQPTFDAMVAQLDKYGMSHSATPFAIPAKVVPIVTAPVVAPPKGK
jgi:hypothetical protein